MKKTIEIQKIKVIDDLKVNLEGQAFAFIGKNGSGKSTAIQCIETIFAAKSQIVNPVKKGEKSGSVTFNGSDKNGNPIMILWEVTEDGIGHFKATIIEDNKTKNITNVTKIQELMGVYTPINVQEALFAMRYAETRKKFINDYILPCIGLDNIIRLNEIDLLISDSRKKECQNNLYHTRTELKKEHEKILAQYDAINIPEDISSLKEEDIIKLKKSLEEKTHNFNELKNSLFNNNLFIDKLNQELKTIVNVGIKINEFIKNFTKDKNDELVFIKQDLLNVYNKLNKYYETKQNDAMYTSKTFYDLEKEISELKTQYDKIIMYSQMVEQKKELKIKSEKLFENIVSKNNEMEKLKKERQTILSSNKLPAGLELNDNENLTFDGFPFHETSVSETKANIAMLKLMTAVSNSELLNIGDWSKYDSESKKEIIEFAKKENRILIGQQVTENENVELFVIIK
jgi:predicted ATP-dependent endonuclease of OLD family